jgi:para-aminobenzoate synthetase component I
MHLNDNSSTNGQCLNYRISSLIGLAKFFGKTNSAEGLTDLSLRDRQNHSNSCLLLSQNEGYTRDQSRSNGFSFYMANPTESAILSQKEEIDKWQKQLASLQPSNSTSENEKQIPFHSGWVGYYAYPSKTISNAEFHYYPWSICLDHQTNEFSLVGKPDEAAYTAFQFLTDKSNQALLLKLAQSSSNFFTESFEAKWQKTDYEKAFIKVQSYLQAGDCYQVNLTQPHSAQYTGSALDTLLPLYSALNPNYGCYFEGKDCQLVSVSPERFISIDSTGRIEAKPIKGTIKRSHDPIQDQLLINELSNSPKNQAENLMIVDLLRNDLSMSAQPGSVKVDNLFELESHPNVHHLVSTITAQLKSGISPTEAISNAFPGGSITGAPKKRAMEIISELEAQPRSLYCGSFGYYSDSGNTDFNILIRSLEFRDNTITCWGGGGITVDSDCDDEYEESLTKIRRIMETVEKI